MAMQYIITQWKQLLKRLHKRIEHLMKTKNVVIITVCSIIVAIVILVVGSITSIPWLALFTGIQLSPSPPKPEITYGEFPFELVYEVDGNLIIVNDVYVCKYDGIGSNTGTLKYRKWKGYIKSSKQQGVLLTEDDDREIYCFVGSAEYYMDDEEYPEQTPLSPRVYDIRKKKYSMDYEIYTSDELLERYNINIISWNFSDPIENSFGDDSSD